MIQAAIQPAEAGASMLEHIAAILRMKAAKLNLNWTKEFSTAQLTACCERLAAFLPDSEEYPENIQRELIQDPEFAPWLARLLSLLKTEPEKGEDAEQAFSFRRSWHDVKYALSDLLETCWDSERHISTYSEADVLTALRRERFTSRAQLTYLENYAPMDLSSEDGMWVAANLSACVEAPIVLTEEQKALLKEPFVTGRWLFSSEPFEKISELFCFCPGLAEIAGLLQQNGVTESLTLSNYMCFAEDAQEYRRLLAAVIQRLGSQHAAELIYFWQKNGCDFSELQRIERRTRGEEGRDWEAALSTYSGYINLLYGTRFKRIDLSHVAGYQEDILTYAIVHNKKHFIRLVDENAEQFLKLSSRSILFLDALYREHFNLNELTAKDLADCAWMVAGKLSRKLFMGNCQYTFAELKLLYDVPQEYVTLYGSLRSQSVDDRIRVLRQLLKRGALSEVENEDDLSVLAGLLDRKPLHNWRREELGHISGLTASETVRMLIHLEKLAHLLPSIKNRTDAMLILRSLDHLDQYSTAGELKADLLDKDQDWHALAESMELSPEFMTRHRETIIEFLCKDGAGIAQIYREALNDKQLIAFHRVVKAELMGQFNTLKYFEGDLERELACMVPPQVKAAWPQNLSAAQNGIQVWERDDFFSTMLLGTEPYRTCLSYLSGSYRHCLLACFDSNKKVLYAEKDGRVIGRACLRLTKCRLDGKGKDEDASGNGFNFVDLEDVPGSRQQKQLQADECAALFLERPYISGAGPEDEQLITALFVELAEKKAGELGVMLVLSMDYADAKADGFAQTRLHIYISASKAGEQYLDSLGGTASVSAEGSYRENRFLMKRAADLLAG